jgi:hypothetical protein
MDEADLLSELSAIRTTSPTAGGGAAKGASGSGSSSGKKTTTRLQEVMAALVRDYLSSQKLSAVEDIFDAERPMSRHAVRDREALVEALKIEPLAARNKKEHQYKSVGEVLAHYYFSGSITAKASSSSSAPATPSSSKKSKDKEKDKKKSSKKSKSDRRSGSGGGGGGNDESSMDSDEAAEAAREAALAQAVKPDAEFDDVSDQKVQLVSSNIGRYTVGDAFTGGPTGDIKGRIVNKLADDFETAPNGPGSITVALSEARRTFTLASSNVAKYVAGMPFNNGQVEGFILKVEGSTNDGKAGQGSVVVALKPTVNSSTAITFVRRAKLSKKPGELAGGDFTVSDVQEARILLMDHVGDVLISNVSSADVLVGPAAGCVRLKDCSKCNIVVACREVKVAACSHVRLFLSTATPPVIGWGSSHIFIGPFTAAYPRIKDHFAAAQLNPRHNCWRQAVDRDAGKVGRVCFPSQQQEGVREFGRQGGRDREPRERERDKEAERERGKERERERERDVTDRQTERQR